MDENHWKIFEMKIERLTSDFEIENFVPFSMSLIEKKRFFTPQY